MILQRIVIYMGKLAEYIAEAFKFTNDLFNTNPLLKEITTYCAWGLLFLIAAAVIGWIIRWYTN